MHVSWVTEGHHHGEPLLRSTEVSEGQEKERDSPCTASVLAEWIENKSMCLGALMCYKGLQNTWPCQELETRVPWEWQWGRGYNWEGPPFSEPGATNTYMRRGKARDSKATLACCVFLS